LLWVLLIPYGEYIYLKLDLGSLPDIDLSRLALMVLGARLLAGSVAAAGRAPDGVRYWLPRFTLPDALMLAFSVTIALSVRVDIPFFFAGPWLMYYVAPPLTSYFARTWLHGEKAFAITIGVVALGSALLGIIAVREQLTGLALFSPRAGPMAYEMNIRKVLSLFGAPGVMTTSLAVAVPLLVLGIRRAGSWQGRLLLGLALAADLLGVFFVYVRAGWLAAALGLGGMIALVPAIRRWALRLLPAIVLAVALLVGAVIDPTVVRNRLASEAPIGYRLQAWEIAWVAFRSSPITGAGFNAFGEIAVSQFGWDPHEVPGQLPNTHNSYLFVLSSGGLLAIVPYVGIFLALLWRGLTFWRRQPARRELVAALWATVFSYMVINGTLDAIDIHFTNVLLFLIIGALLAQLETPPLASRLEASA
jgi:O-antigen ligase